MAAGQVVDTETAQEFMAQALEKVERVALSDIVAELEHKSTRFKTLLAPEALPALDRSQLRSVLRTIFATRRKADTILDVLGEDELRTAMAQLLHGPAATPERFQAFVDSLSGFWGDVRLARPARAGQEGSELPENMLCDLASELLHFSRPDDYWLWTRWMWDPRVATGALPLVTMDDYDLHGQAVGETYMKVGVAVAFVRATGEAVGFARFGVGHSPFGIDVFLACVYAVYLYTTLRLRMTQEFNKVVPQLPELSRRLLGVWKMEI
jgi:hypothetical protein